MAIDDNTTYGLTGAQVKELPGKIEAIKGLARVLTTDDYNWPTNNPNKVALWMLDDGMYYAPDGVSYQRNSSDFGWSECSYIISHRGTQTVIYTIGAGTIYVETTNTSSGAAGTARTTLVLTSGIKNNLTSTDTDKPLSAAQGKVLKDLVDSLAIRGAGAPTTSTVGSVGTLYEDTTNGKLYICTDATNPYVWEEVGAGAGGNTVVELSVSDYNYSYGGTGSNNTVALWQKRDGIYSIPEGVYSTYNNESRGGSTARIAIVSTSHNGTYKIIYYFLADGWAGSGVTYANNGNKQSTATISGPAVVQATGTSTTSVMSQNEVTSMVYADPSTKEKIQIGAGATSSSGTAVYGIAIGRRAKSKQQYGIAIGGSQNNTNTQATGYGAIAIGTQSSASAKSSVAIGYLSSASAQGEFAIGLPSGETIGYNSSNYRLLTGLYDPQSAHDAATKGYVDTAVAGAGAATFTTNEWNALWA